MIKIKRNVKRSERRKLGIKRSSKAWKFSGLRNFVAKNSPLRNRHFIAKLFRSPKKSLRKRHFAAKWFHSPMPPFVKIFAAAKHPFGTWVPFRSPVHSFRSCKMVAKSPHLKILQRTHHEWKCCSRTPIGHILITSRSSFYAYHMSFQSSGSQESIASNGAQFGVETKKLWLFEDDCANHEWKCRTSISQLLDTFWSTSWSSNYAYYISFWSSGSQESNASNGVRIGVETKKLWPFEDEHTKLSENFAAAPPFRRWFRSCETTPWHTSAISQPPNPISQLRNGLRKWHSAAKIPFGCEMISQPHSYPLPNPPCAAKMAFCYQMIFKLPNGYEIISKLPNGYEMIFKLQNGLRKCFYFFHGLRKCFSFFFPLAARWSPRYKMTSRL